MRPGAAPLALMLFVVSCPTALAQGRAPVPESVAVAAEPVQLPAREPATAIERRRAAAHADARICLEFPTRLEVITCAEKYRWTKGR